VTGQSARQQDAGLVRRALYDAGRKLDTIQRFWGRWADDVRQDVAARRAVPPGADLRHDPEYARAVSGYEAIRRARAALLDAEAWLTQTEAAAAAAAAAEPQAARGQPEITS
jgi:hypothetical protein